MGAPDIHQCHYKFGVNDGPTVDPDSVNFGALDTNLTNQAINTPIHIRIQMYNDGANTGNDNWQLYYDTDNTPATAIQVTTISAVVKFVNDANIADATATDNSTVVFDESPARNWKNGYFIDESDETPVFILDADEYIDLQFNIQFDDLAIGSSIYYFYIRRDDTVLNSYDSIPTVTIIATQSSSSSSLSSSLSSSSSSLSSSSSSISSSVSSSDSSSSTYTVISNGEIKNISETTFFEFISDNGNTATMIINNKNFVIKNKNNFLEWDVNSVINKFIFTEINESINQKIDNIEIKITYLGTGSLLFLIEFIENISKNNFIFIYRLNDTDSLELATYYASKYDMDIISANTSFENGKINGVDWEVRGQLVGIGCSSTEILSSETDFNNEVLNPIKDAIENSIELNNMAIWGIILGYNIPGGFYDDGIDIISSTSRISRLNKTYSKKIKNKLFNRNIFKRFDADDAELMLICSRIDAPTLVLAKGYIDNAEDLKKQTYVNGTFYIDPYSDRAGPTADIYRNKILDFYSYVLPKLNLDIWATTFMDPYIDVSIPYVEDDSFVWSWFSDRSSSDFFQNSNAARIFFYNADYDGAFTIRNINGTRWPFLSMNAGYISTAGSMSNPTNEGLLDPSAFFKSLLNGAIIGESYLFSLPFLDWTISLFGDPLIQVEFSVKENYKKYKEDEEDGIEENESWNRMSKDLARTAAQLYKKEQEYYNILTNIVDLTSQDTDAEVALLIPANDLYNTNNEIKRISQLKPVTDKFFMYPQKRFIGIETIDDYLNRQNYKVSRLLSEISSDTIISNTNLLDQGWWQFEFIVQDENINNFINYGFKLNIYNDVCYSSRILNEIDSSDLNNWVYERERDNFVSITSDGVSSSYIGRRIRYESKSEEYLTRGETYYYTITQYNIDTNEQYSTRQFSDIIWT